jgi:hypothetical protein
MIPRSWKLEAIRLLEKMMASRRTLAAVVCMAAAPAVLGFQANFGALSSPLAGACRLRIMAALFPCCRAMPLDIALDNRARIAERTAGRTAGTGRGRELAVTGLA